MEKKVISRSEFKAIKKQYKAEFKKARREYRIEKLKHVGLLSLQFLTGLLVVAGALGLLSAGLTSVASLPALPYAAVLVGSIATGLGSYFANTRLEEPTRDQAKYVKTCSKTKDETNTKYKNLNSEYEVSPGERVDDKFMEIEKTSTEKTKGKSKGLKKQKTVDVSKLEGLSM